MIKRMTLFIFFFSILSAGQNLFSQVDYLPGIAILQSGDTLFGSFALRFEIPQDPNTSGERQDGTSYKTTSTVLYHRASTNSDSSPIELHTLRLLHFDNGLYYESLLIPGTDSYDLFRLWIKGSINLYTRTDSQLEEHIYFLFGKDGLQELIETSEEVKELLSGNIKTYKKTNKLYYRVLSAAYLSCPSILPGLDQYNLNINDIKRSLLKYYKCKGEPYQEYKPNKSSISRPEIGIYSGINYFPNFWSAPGAKTNIGYNVGAFVNMYLFAGRKSLSIQGEINFLRYRQENVDYAGNSFVGQATSLTNIIKKYFRFDRTAVYLGVGYTLNVYSNINVSGLLLNTGICQTFGPVQLFVDYRYQKASRSGISYGNIGVILNSDAFKN